ncbi:MAG TPA: alpha/beta fold hydrolase [Anaerolineales bacterium]|nr:alpha/beta fold hydrolase [Anaerolineales bacterium]
MGRLHPLHVCAILRSSRGERGSLTEVQGGGVMKRKLRGLKRRAIQLDFSLYRVAVPIAGLSDVALSVIDIWPEGAEKTIMFVHGYAGCAETWEYQVNHFARDCRVVAPDLRGHGQSDAPFTEYTMSELVDDINTIAEALDLPERFILAGHSFGGSICVEYANAYPERLERLVLLATAGEYPLPRGASWLARVPAAAFRPWWKYRPRWNADVHVMKRMMLNNMRRWKGWSLLENIRTPTLIITGERDRYFPRWVFEKVAEMVPNAEVIDVGASKHKVQLERHQAVNRAIERFICEGEGGWRITWRGPKDRPRQPDHRPWLRSYGKHTPHTVPIPRQPLHRFLEVAADWVPKRTATVFYGSELTYQQLDARVNQFAHALHGLGVRPGDRVMIVLPNMPQMVIAYYATLKIGGVVVLPNPDADGPRIIEQIRQTGAKVFVTLKNFGGLVRAVEAQVPLKIVLTDIRAAVSGRVYRQLVARWEAAGLGPEDEAEEGEARFRMGRLMTDTPGTPPAVEVSSDDLAAILYTSGTTDEPKGVCLTHFNLVANAVQTRHWIPDLHFGEETFLAVIPLTHSYGMTIAMNVPVAMGATILLLPVFELEQVLNHIKQYRPSIFPGVPSIYMAINQAPDVRSYGLSSIRACVSGAAPLPVEVQEAFEKLTHGRLVEGYGLTEASPVTHINPFHETGKVGSIGIPIPNTDAKIVDLMTGEDLPPGQVGELVVRGPQVMQGYWRQEDERDSESALRDGWLYTGDVAVMDGDGFFQIISRKRDTIMAGEYSVYPRDVEEVLYENCKVMEVAVVGVQTGEGGQRVKAFVVPRPGTSLSEGELLELCRRRLEPYAVPWEIEFRQNLPKSFVGKVLRRMLVEEGG